MESTMLPNIDLRQRKAEISSKQVVDTRRKGRSSNLLPQLISEDINTSRTERNRILVENQQARNLLEKKQRDASNMIIAIQQINDGVLSSYAASQRYGVEKKKLIRHVAAAREQGTNVPVIKRGRLPYLSDDVIEEEKIDISSKDSLLVD